MLTVGIALRTISAPNAREHWAVRARRVKAERTTTFLSMKEARRFAPAGPLVITLTRLTGPRGKHLDDDNLAGSLKAVRDGVADWLGCADNDPRLTWRYGQERGEIWAVRIQVMEAGQWRN